MSSEHQHQRAKWPSGVVGPRTQGCATGDAAAYVRPRFESARLQDQGEQRQSLRMLFEAAALGSGTGTGRGVDALIW